MTKLIFLLLLFAYVDNTYAQTQNYPAKKTSNNCYCMIINENSESDWKEVECELIKLDKEELENLQKKLKSLDYDVDITGIIDEKTNVAYKTEKKEKRARKIKKELRKVKKE